ncbi:helix-turn-helix transcriptional regulator [Rhizobium tubonense]|nr:LuxR family transcriptional regulator [Rhizobium tubonense]
MRESANIVRRSVQDTLPPVVSALSASHQRLLDEAAKKAGFEYFLMAHFPRGDSAGFADNRIASNWPQALVDEYSGADLFHRSQIVAALKQTNMPIFCDCAGFDVRAANGEDKLFDNRFAGHGLGRTFAFSLHDAALQHYIFAFSGSRAKLSRQESMELVYGSMQILEVFVRHGKAAEAPAERLSNREIECLRWSAAGKSSEEIAIILALSTHTVASYLKSAMRKLNSVNRMQAVARAFRYRLL